jgi:hypothetical protein
MFLRCSEIEARDKANAAARAVKKERGEAHRFTRQSAQHGYPILVGHIVN